MSMSSTATAPASPRIRRYVEWMKRRALAIIAAHVVVLVGAIYLIAFHLPLYADFSYLLPQDAPAVRDLRRLEARVAGGDLVLVIVQAPTAELRAATVTDLVHRAAALDGTLVEAVESDDAEIRDFLRARRHLFVPYADLVKAREALAARIHTAKLKANPLYIELDDAATPEAAAATERERKSLDDLRAKRNEAEARLAKSGNVSADGLSALVTVRAPFRATAAGRGKALIHALVGIRTLVLAAHPTAHVGFTGGIVTSVAEHESISQGMLVSGVLTTLLVSLVLLLYFRSATLLVVLVGTLGAATAIAFGFAALTVGHLNAATAFLGAIIAGNGINYGILLIARYLEERRRSVDVTIEDALAIGIQHTLRPTAVASLGAAIAYGSLAATSFKGFADFAVIGAVGMIVCWAATYLLLPAVLLRFGRQARMFNGDPAIGKFLVRYVGFRHSGRVAVIAAIATVIGIGIVAHYIADDPFEYDINHLRSKSADALEARRWLEISDRTFGRGISGRTYIAADRPEQVPMIVAALQARDAKVPAELQTIGVVTSVLDVVTDRQAEKLVVLGEIRTLLDDSALDALEAHDRAELRELRPPDGLKAFTAADLPASVRGKLTERDGRIGYMVSVRPSDHLNEWDGRDLIRFATAVRQLQLPDGEAITTSGSSVIFADIVESIADDGPRVTAIAAIGLILMVLVLVGPNRRAFAVLAATVGGSLGMVATCAVLDLRVNFLDFVALPITLGLGIDYAINIAHRHDSGDGGIADPIVTLRTSGSAVAVCSLTTIIGYGSLLASENLAIRGFGVASLIGEVACVMAALILVPALLGLHFRQWRAARSNRRS